MAIFHKALTFWMYFQYICKTPPVFLLPCGFNVVLSYVLTLRRALLEQEMFCYTDLFMQDKQQESLV